MIRSVQPTSALPVTRNMPYYSASVPTRTQPRNMTGIYLGLEGNINPPNSRLNLGRSRKGTSQKIRTPAEDRRYKMVELLRIKEETKGFKGQPLKKRKPASDDVSLESEPIRHPHPQQLQHRKWGPAKSANPRRFEDVIRQNPRNYTAIINNGVTRSENLTGVMSFAEQHPVDAWGDLGAGSPPGHVQHVPEEAIVEEVKRIASARADLHGLEECFKKVCKVNGYEVKRTASAGAALHGLEECFKKICKGNTESLQSLLPLRKPSARPDSYSTGFTVRSYRNPNNAELLADFEGSSSHNARPKTVPATMTYPRQPHVPSPYFFKYYNKPGTAHSGKKLFEDQPGQSSSVPGDKIVGVPGSGSISRSLKPRNSAWSEGDAIRIRRGSPRTDSPIKDIGQSIHASSTTRHDASQQQQQQPPLEIRAEGYHSNTDDKSTFSDRQGIAEPPNTLRSSDHPTTRFSTSTDNTDRTTPHLVSSSHNTRSDRPESLDRFQITNSFSSAGNPRASSRGGGGGKMVEADNTIRLDLETEDGKKQQIFLDDKEYTNPEQSEKRMASEAKVASIKEDARQRKLEFEQILDEHAQIVTTIVRQASSESNNDAFQSAEVPRDQ